MPKYILFHKPFDVISQFTKHPAHRSLADFKFPKDLYPVGRLDTDSEGLLLLTDDGDLQHHLIEPKYAHERSYTVQVERIPDASALQQLRSGVVIEGKKTKPAKVRRLEPEPVFSERSKPVRFRKNVPTCWIELTITEGRNRQVRRMTAGVGHPTLRLIRTGIMFLTLEGLEPGKWRELSSDEVRRLKLGIRLAGTASQVS